MAIEKELYYKVLGDITDVIKMVGELQAGTLKKEETTIEACELTPVIEKLKDIQIKAEEIYIGISEN